MTVHQARIIALAAVLVGTTALVPITRLHARQTLDEMRVMAEQGDAEAQRRLGDMYSLHRPPNAKVSVPCTSWRATDAACIL